MGAKYQTKKDGFSSMKKTARTIGKRNVDVGIFDSEQAFIARIQEYGCKIPITPKMRAWLHYNGLHVKDSTTFITIPERSFLRASWDEQSQTVLAKARKALPDVLIGHMSEEQYCKMAGLMLTSMVKDYARNLSSPANHPFTIERKGSSNPLVDTGKMIEHITYQIK